MLRSLHQLAVGIKEDVLRHGVVAPLVQQKLRATEDLRGRGVSVMSLCCLPAMQEITDWEM